MATLTTPLRYDNPTDVQMRLHGGIILYKGDPYYVAAHYPDLHIDIRNLYTDKVTNVHSSDVDIDLTSPPLGWCNLNPIPAYVMRAPTRQQKQAFEPRMAQLWSPMEGKSSPGFGITKKINVKNVADMILGKYPTIQEILSSRGGAFTRSWAMFPLLPMAAVAWTVYHKTIPVGLFDLKKKSFLFSVGMLTKVRRHTLEDAFNTEGVSYGIEER